MKIKKPGWIRTFNVDALQMTLKSFSSWILHQATNNALQIPYLMCKWLLKNAFCRTQLLHYVLARIKLWTKASNVISSDWVTETRRDVKRNVIVNCFEKYGFTISLRNFKVMMMVEIMPLLSHKYILQIYLLTRLSKPIYIKILME